MFCFCLCFLVVFVFVLFIVVSVWVGDVSCLFDFIEFDCIVLLCVDLDCFVNVCWLVVYLILLDEVCWGVFDQLMLVSLGVQYEIVEDVVCVVDVLGIEFMCCQFGLLYCVGMDSVVIDCVGFVLMQFMLYVIDVLKCLQDVVYLIIYMFVGGQLLVFSFDVQGDYCDVCWQIGVVVFVVFGLFNCDYYIDVCYVDECVVYCIYMVCVLQMVGMFDLFWVVDDVLVLEIVFVQVILLLVQVCQLVNQFYVVWLVQVDWLILYFVWGIFFIVQGLFVDSEFLLVLLVFFVVFDYQLVIVFMVQWCVYLCFYVLDVVVLYLV